jgi:hypothetical protein
VAAVRIGAVAAVRIGAVAAVRIGAVAAVRIGATQGRRGRVMAVERDAELPHDDWRPAELPAGDKATFRLAVYAAVLVVVLFAGYGIGRLTGGPANHPALTATDSDSMPGMGGDESRPHTHDTGGGGTGSTVPTAAAAVGGVSLSSDGLTLVPLRTTFPDRVRQRLTFRIAGAGGVAVTTFTRVHDRLLHLIVVRRDLTGYQHLHPVMAPDGTWSIDLALPAPGVYRMIADFTAVAGGREIPAALGADLTVAGRYQPVELPAPARTVATGHFTVTYEGTPGTGSMQPIRVGVTGPDRGPAALEPYLGAYGHLVAIRQGDLGYVHVHPEPQPAGGKVTFWLTAPSPGSYRMFFDFQVAGQVHTAAWTVIVP